MWDLERKDQIDDLLNNKKLSPEQIDKRIKLINEKYNQKVMAISDLESLQNAAESERLRLYHQKLEKDHQELFQSIRKFFDDHRKKFGLLLFFIPFKNFKFE